MSSRHLTPRLPVFTGDLCLGAAVNDIPFRGMPNFRLLGDALAGELEPEPDAALSSGISSRRCEAFARLGLILALMGEGAASWKAFFFFGVPDLVGGTASRM